MKQNASQNVWLQWLKKKCFRKSFQTSRIFNANSNRTKRIKFKKTFEILKLWAIKVAEENQDQVFDFYRCQEYHALHLTPCHYFANLLIKIWFFHQTNKVEEVVFKEII